MLASGCGGSPESHVAQLGSTTTSPQLSSATAQASGAVAFSRCVRSHGVPAYPDPSDGGLLPKETPQQLGVSPSQLQAAQKACIHLVPGGGFGRRRPAWSEQRKVIEVCRLHPSRPVPNMPDPDSRGHLDIGPGTGVNVNGPAFEAAYAVCKSDLLP